jgi:hypothetical protein
MLPVRLGYSKAFVLRFAGLLGRRDLRIDLVVGREYMVLPGRKFLAQGHLLDLAWMLLLDDSYHLMHLLVSGLGFDRNLDKDNCVDLEVFNLLEAFTNSQIIKEIMDFHRVNCVENFHIIKIIVAGLQIMVKIID